VIDADRATTSVCATPVFFAPASRFLTLLPRVPLDTHRKRIPWTWAGLMAIPWIASSYMEKMSQQPIIFTLNKFVDDPAIISFLSSINILFNFMVGVVVAYLSDHVWTRIGRRRPFLIITFAGTGTLLLFIPLAGNIWVLAAGLIAYQFFADFGKPWEPLFNEVVPPPQRGRATMLRMIAINLGGLFFAKVLIWQFAREYSVSTPFGPLTGEMVTYWTVAAFFYGVALFLWLAIRETRPPDIAGRAATEYRPTRLPGVQWLTEKGKSGGLKAFFGDMFAERQAIWVYLLYLCPAIMGAVGVYNSNYVLFVTVQLGVSKADYGNIEFYVILSLFLPTILAGVLADKVSRHLLFRAGIVLPALIQIGFWIYLRFITNYEATFGVLLGVLLATGVCQTLLWAVWGPLIYDYIPSNRMGSYVAGISFLQGMLGFVLMNIGGLWVKGFTAVFGTPNDTPYDYSSIILLWLILAAITATGTYIFQAAERRGDVKPLGKIEVEQL